MYIHIIYCNRFYDKDLQMMHKLLLAPVDDIKVRPL